MKKVSSFVNGIIAAFLIVSLIGCSGPSIRTDESAFSETNRSPSNVKAPEETVVVLADPNESEIRALVMHTVTTPRYRFTVSTCLLRALAENKGVSMTELLKSPACHIEIMFNDAKDVQAFIDKVAAYSDSNKKFAAGQLWSSHGYFIASTVVMSATALGSLWLAMGSPYSGQFSDIRGPLFSAIERITLNFQFMKDFKLLGPKTSHWIGSNLAEGVPKFSIGTEKYVAAYARSTLDIAKAEGAIRTLKVANKLVIPVAIGAVVYGFVTASKLKAKESGAYDSSVLAGTAKSLLASNGVENPKDITFKSMARIFRDTGYAPKFGTTPLKMTE